MRTVALRLSHLLSESGAGGGTASLQKSSWPDFPSWQNFLIIHGLILGEQTNPNLCAIIHKALPDVLDNLYD